MCSLIPSPLPVAPIPSSLPCNPTSRKTPRGQIVAPMVPLATIAKVISRLTPIVALDGFEHMVLMPALTGMSVRDLRERHGSLASSRSELLTAIDLLFFGV